MLSRRIYIVQLLVRTGSALEEGAQPRAQTVLGTVGRIDANVLRGEVAGPVACAGGAGVQVQDDRHVVGEEFVAGGAFVEIEGLAAAEYRDPGHGYIDARRIKAYPCATGGSEDASPVGISSGKSGFDQWRSGYRFRDAPGRCFSLCAAHFNFDYALRAFAIGDDL